MVTTTNIKEKQGISTRKRQHATTQTESQADRRNTHTHTRGFTHYYDRNRSRKVCQEYQTNVLSEGNRSGVIAVPASVGTAMRITEHILHGGDRDLFTVPIPRLLTIQ